MATEANARVMSTSRTSLVPSTIDGKVEILPLMPKRRAMSAMVAKPNWAPILALTVLIERENASRSVTGPWLVRVELRGLQPSIVIGRRRWWRSASSDSRGQIENSLNADPGCARLGRAVV